MRRLFADFLVALCLLAAAELAVRLFLPHDVSGRFFYGYDRDSGFVEAGDLVHLVRTGGRRFHPQTFPRRRPPDTLRIMVVGDSVPRGPDLRDAYPHQLQQILTAAGWPVEVINLAIPGFGVRRTQLIVQKILAYEPSVIIVHLNDSNEYEDERDYQRCQEFQGWHPRHWLLKSFILARAYEIKTEKLQWRLLPSRIRQQAMVHDADAELAASMDADRYRLWQQRVQETTRQTVAQIRARGVAVVLVAQAVWESETPGAAALNDHGLDALAQSLLGPGVEAVSMAAVFAGLEPRQEYFRDKAHLTPRGHRLLAAALSRVILAGHPPAREQLEIGQNPP
jgi:lysophospholipase L1-like esterase